MVTAGRGPSRSRQGARNSSAPVAAVTPPQLKKELRMIRPRGAALRPMLKRADFHPSTGNRCFMQYGDCASEMARGRMPPVPIQIVYWDRSRLKRDMELSRQKANVLT